MENLTIRLATEEDLHDINAIYNHYVLNSTCTYQTEPETDEDRALWFAAHGPKHPITVAEWGGEVVGWAALHPFRSRCAYSQTVENSVYIRHDRQRLGIGQALLTDCIEKARSLGHHVIIAGISADQEPSIALHSKMGFVQVGRLLEVGRKFDRWLDVMYMELIL